MRSSLTLLTIGLYAGLSLGGPWCIAGEYLFEGEVGHQSSLLTKSSELSRNRPYFIVGGTYTTELGQEGASLLELKGAVRDAATLSTQEDSHVDIKALSMGYQGNYVTSTLGFQEIPWGETFGVFISDLVNPRDLSDPLLNQPAWTRIPVFAWNTSIVTGNWSLQGVFVPVPRNNRLPKKGSEFDLFSSRDDSVAQLPILNAKKFELSETGDDFEGGARAGHLFDFGLDITGFFYSHWNRNPVYQFTFTQDGPALQAVRRRMYSTGASASQALGMWVLRGDFVYTNGAIETQPDLSTPNGVNQYQSILGADITTDNQWTLGGQYHLDSTPERSHYWASVQISKSLWNDLIVPKVFAFGGINNNDVWIQPQITWNATDNLEVSIRADFVEGSVDTGILGPLSEKDRFMTWIKAKI